jgi:hypothetical protein
VPILPLGAKCRFGAQYSQVHRLRHLASIAMLVPVLQFGTDDTDDHLEPILSLVWVAPLGTNCADCFISILCATGANGIFSPLTPFGQLAQLVQQMTTMAQVALMV